MTMPEKMTEKTAYMPSQNAPVATAHGKSLRQETRPASRNDIVNHQKPMNAGMLTIHHRTGALERNQGPTEVPTAPKPTASTSQIAARSLSRGPRESRPNIRRYSAWTAVATAMPARMKKTQDRPVTALEVADEEVNRCPTSAAACLLRPSRTVRADTADRPVRAVAMRKNGTAHRSSMAASNMAWFMKSAASSWCHRYSAQDPEYFFWPHSAARLTRRRVSGWSWALMPVCRCGGG